MLGVSDAFLALSLVIRLLDTLSHCHSARNQNLADSQFWVTASPHRRPSKQNDSKNNKCVSRCRVISRDFRSARWEQAPPAAASAPSHTHSLTLTSRRAPWCLSLPPRLSLPSEGTHTARDICCADDARPRLSCSPPRKELDHVGCRRKVFESSPVRCSLARMPCVREGVRRLSSDQSRRDVIRVTGLQTWSIFSIFQFRINIIPINMTVISDQHIPLYLVYYKCHTSNAEINKKKKH